jgi:predicted nucleotidyltransferase component of viral defense system
MKMPAMSDFVLVGGTALSLLYGHRQSIDIDLFSSKKIDNAEIHHALLERYGQSFSLEDKPKSFGIFCKIAGVKVDIVRYPHPIIRPGFEADGIRFISTEDIVAMKVQAVLGRARKKDFWDIATLLEHFTVDDFVRFHKEKYSTQNLIVTVPQAISYFADAEDDPDPKSLKGQTWDSVKTAIRKEVRGFFK